MYKNIPSKMIAITVVAAPIATMLLFNNFIFRPYGNACMVFYGSYALLILPALAYYAIRGEKITRIFGVEYSFKKIITSVAIATITTVLPFYFLVAYLKTGAVPFVWPSRINISPYMIISSLLFVGFAEELYFRGYAYDVFNKSFTWSITACNLTINGAIVLSAVAFLSIHDLSFHWPPWGYLAFFPGIVSGILRERTGNVISPILYHIICNTTAFLLNSINITHH